MDNNRGKRQSASIFGGMGFYIALLVCVLAAGVVGYFALLNNDDAALDDGELAAVDQVEEDEAREVSVPDNEPARPVISQEPVTVTRPDVTESRETAAPSAPAEETGEASAPAELPDTAPVIAQEPTHRVVSPLAGETVAAFSVDTLTYDETLGDWRTHDGIDIASSLGTRVQATAKGVVSAVYEDDVMGVTVVVDHGNELFSVYSNLEENPPVAVGDTVASDTVVGEVGETSVAESGKQPHLHFAMYQGDAPINPEDYLGQ